MKKKKLFNLFKNGLEAMAEKPHKTFILLGYIFLMLIVYCANSPLINASINCSNPVVIDRLISFGIIILLFSGIFLIVILIGMPMNNLQMQLVSSKKETNNDLEKIEGTEKKNVTG